MEGVFSPPLPADACFAILNLIHGYADALDRGDFALLDRMFLDADVYMPGSTTPDIPAGSGSFGAYVKRAIRTYAPHDTPRTRHVTTNVQFRFPEPDSAETRACFTVLQEVDEGELQVIIAGAYDDRFRRTEKGWQFVERREEIAGKGNLLAHLQPQTLQNL